MERETNIGIVNAQELTPKSQEEKFQNTIAFLKAAIAEGAYLKTPFWIGRGNSIRQISEEVWVRQKNIVGTYFGSPAALEDIRKMYKITKEMVRGIKDRGMHNLWLNCSLETQAVFPMQEIALGKPRSQRSKERTSRLKGGVSISIRAQMASGKTGKQIREEGIYSTEQIKNARKILKGWGVEDLPYVTPPFQNLELENKLRNAEADEEKQELLNQVKHRFYRLRVRGNNPFLITIKHVMKEAGLNRGWQGRNLVMFYASLKSVDFPMGEITQKRMSTGKEMILTYNFILAKDKERAKQILLADPNLQRFRRSQPKITSL